MAGVLILAAGSGGLPFAEDIGDIIDTISGGYQWLGTIAVRRRQTWRTGRVGDRGWVQNLIPGTALGTTGGGHERSESVSGQWGTASLRRRDPDRAVVAEMGRRSRYRASHRAAMEMAPTAFRNLAQGAKMAARGIQRTPRAQGRASQRRRSQWPRWSGSIPSGLTTAPSARSGAGPAAGHGQAEVFFRDRGRQGEARAEVVRAMREWNAKNPDARVSITAAAIGKACPGCRAEGRRPDAAVVAKKHARTGTGGAGEMKTDNSEEVGAYPGRSAVVGDLRGYVARQAGKPSECIVDTKRSCGRTRYGCYPRRGRTRDQGGHR